MLAMRPTDDWVLQREHAKDWFCDLLMNNSVDHVRAHAPAAEITEILSMHFDDDSTVTDISGEFSDVISDPMDAEELEENVSHASKCSALRACALCTAIYLNESNGSCIRN